MQGDHLSVHYGSFYHHGIDCGDGTVIHLSQEHGSVVQSSFAEFADGRCVHTENSPRLYKRKKVVERAKRRLHQDGYHLLVNNCEHFVYWCRMGKKRSRQVQCVGKVAAKQIAKAGVKAGSKQVARLGAKQIGKQGSKALAKSGAKSGAKVMGKTLAKGGGALFAVDLLQCGVEQAGGNLGLSQSEAETAGKAVGLGGHLAVGAAVGGPVGAAAAGVVWGVGEMIGSWFD